MTMSGTAEHGKGNGRSCPRLASQPARPCALLNDLLKHLEVREGRMQDNLLATRGFVYAERIMLAMAPLLGKQSAHDLVYRVAMEASERGVDLREAVLAEPEIAARLGIARIENLFVPAESVGYCGEMVDRVISEWEATARADNGGEY